MQVRRHEDDAHPAGAQHAVDLVLAVDDVADRHRHARGIAHGHLTPVMPAAPPTAPPVPATPCVKTFAETELTAPVPPV